MFGWGSLGTRQRGLHPAGEAAAAAAAADPSLHNGAPGRGRGGACSEDGSRDGGSMGGTKERLSGWKGDVDVWPALSDSYTISPKPVHNS